MWSTNTSTSMWGYQTSGTKLVVDLIGFQAAITLILAAWHLVLKLTIVSVSSVRCFQNQQAQSISPCIRLCIICIWCCQVWACLCWGDWQRRGVRIAQLASVCKLGAERDARLPRIYFPKERASSYPLHLPQIPCFEGTHTQEAAWLLHLLKGHD